MGQFFSVTPGSYGELVAGSYGHAGNVISNQTGELKEYLGKNTGNYRHETSTADLALPPIPFEWMLSPSVDAEANITEDGLNCPGPDATLLAFGIADLATVAATVLLASRPVMHKLTLGRFGNRNMKPDSVVWTWSIHFGLQLVANAIVAGLMGRTSGYHSLNMWHIFALFSSRPQSHIAVLAALRAVIPVKNKTSKRGSRNGRGPGASRRGVVPEFIYADAYITSALSQLFLTLTASIFTTVTWARYPGEQTPPSETKMFMDSLVRLVEASPGLIFLAMVVLVPIYRRFGEAFPLEWERGDGSGRTGAWLGMTAVDAARRQRNPHNMGRRSLWTHRIIAACTGLAIYGLVVVAQYCYWAGLLTLTGPLWCPPRQNLIKAAVVWTISTVIGNMVGGAS